MKDKPEQIAALAAERKLVRIRYRRPGETDAGEYVVEPYRLQRTGAGLALHAWQVSPAPEGRGDGWRDFRLDRVADVADAGGTFVPRMPVELGHDSRPQQPGRPAAPAPAFHGWGDQPIAAMGAAEDYFRYVEDAMLDAKVTPEELALARSLGDRVEPHERKAVHARVYANGPGLADQPPRGTLSPQRAGFPGAVGLGAVRTRR